MSQLIYNWKRFWCLRDGGFHIDTHGFLLRSEYFEDTVEFQSIAEIPCLILLGEPGIGKSQALKDAVKFVSKSFLTDKCFYLDLRSFGSETRLYDALFKSREIEEWLSSTHRLHLFLDSFDECLQRVDTIAPLIIDELKTGKYPINRLLFRIASRTAEFPKLLEQDLKTIWKPQKRELPLLKFKPCPRDPAVQIFELCPLQPCDVLEAARINEINPNDFFQEIIRTKSGAWAARPNTLLGIINVYRKNNRLPEKLWDLHEQNARILCDEQNNERRASNILKGKLSAEQRLVIAARIAAVIILCNKIAIWKDAESGETEQSDVLLRELSGYSEESGKIPFPVTEEAVRETLFQTGLFTARDANRLGWGHQTFTEFLAAWYLTQHNLSGEQISSLVINPTDSQQQITPQLQEMVAWLASLRPDIFNEILKTNAILLLRSDVGLFPADLRTKLVDELLNIFSQEEASDWGLHSNYQRLKHPGLAAQLLPVIKNKNANYLARRFAIDVAEACKLRELQNDLADIILDETEPDYVRANAGYALWRVGDAEVRKRIKHYAINGSKNDNDERVRGVALLCNWDENMTTEEVFASLVHSPHLLDSYGLFLSSHFLPKLKVEDLPVALNWVKENAPQFRHDFSIERVIDEIMLIGWQNLNSPGVLPVFAEAALVRIRDYEHDVFNLSNIHQSEHFTEIAADAERRRTVLKAIALLLSEEKHDSFYISHSRILQPRKEDLFWLFEQLNEARTEQEERIWLQFLRNFYSPWEIEPEIFSILCQAYEQNDAVKKYYSWVFREVELGSPEAKSQRESYEQLTAPRREMEAELRKNALKPPPKERVLECLKQFEEGEISFWWGLNLQLTLKPYMKVYGDELQFDLRNLPGWEEADSETRARIIEAAKKYVIDGDPQNDQWVGTTVMHRPAFSGYRALYLLLDESPEFIKQLSGDIWRKWAAVIVSYPLNSHGGEEMIPHQFLVAKAYYHAPDEVIQTILNQIDAENEGAGIILFPQRLDVCWDDNFKAALREKLNDDKLKINSWGRILEELFQHGDAITQEIAQNVLILFLESKTEKERALLAASSLMRHGKGEEWWSLVWKAIEKDTDFGRALVSYVCEQTHPSNKLKENEAAELYLWLIKEFPPNEDPPLPTGGVAFFVSNRMQITDWRNSILSDLKQRGTPESLTALEQIAGMSSELEKQLHWILIEARENVRRHTWEPLTPVALLNLLKQNTTGTSSVATTKVMRTLMSDEEIGKLSWNGKQVADIPALFNFLKIYRDRPNEIVFFIGAGLSRPLFPGWETALEKLVEQVSKRFSYKEKDADLKRMLGAGAFLDVADSCARDLGENNYRAFVEEQFDKDFAPENVPRPYAALLDLMPQTILTTNYDRIPEVGGRGRYRIFTNLNISEAESAIMSNKPTVVKLHGSVTQQNSIVFTRQEYQNTYQNASFKEFISAIFKLKFLIFLGFGLTDPYFNQVLENIYAGNRRILQGKYALLEGISQTEIQSKEISYGLNIIPYRKSDDAHPEVLEFVQLLAKVQNL